MESLDTAIAAFEERSVVVPDGDRPTTFRYRLLRPPVRPGERHPVVLFLHGAGERGDDNTRNLRFLPAWLAEPALRAAHPCFLVAPQCRAESRWADVDWTAAASSPQPATPSLDLVAALAAVDAVLATEAADPDRVAVTGLSMGGYGTWDLAARVPERFAAIMPICGGGDEASAPRLARLPTWCFHGTDDDVVPVGRSRAMIAAIEAAGGRPIYTELPGVDHDAWTPAYRDPAVLTWLLAQRRR